MDGHDIERSEFVPSDCAPSDSSSSLSVALLAGGASAERDVSLESGAEVAAALRAAGHRVETIDPSAQGLDSVDWKRWDACFLALHGGEGEDGGVQSQLRRLGVPYTGSGPAASRLAMSKSASKERFFQAGVPTRPYALFHVDEPEPEIAAKLQQLGYPLAVKPDGQGSSLGVRRVARPSELSTALREGRRWDAFLLAEPWITGREFTVSLLGRRPLPLLEIVSQGEFFDYQAKYFADTTEYRFDHGLPDAVADLLRDTAVAAADALGTQGLSRVDLMLDENQRPQVLEVNTCPGMTSHSLAPMAAARAGMDMPALCDVLLRDALQQGALVKEDRS